MPRQFIIVDPTDEISLLLSQYLSMGWHDADIEDMSLKSLAETEHPQADVIIIGGIEPSNETLNEILKRSRSGETPPIILLSNEDDIEEVEHSGAISYLPMEDLTPLMLNGEIVELMKTNADG